MDGERVCPTRTIAVYTSSGSGTHVASRAAWNMQEWNVSRKEVLELVEVSDVPREVLFHLSPEYLYVAAGVGGFRCASNSMHMPASWLDALSYRRAPSATPASSVSPEHHAYNSVHDEHNFYTNYLLRQAGLLEEREVDEVIAKEFNPVR
eukprot:901748-Pelagomonas_calceolata.AAC.2